MFQLASWAMFTFRGPLAGHVLLAPCLTGAVIAQLAARRSHNPKVVSSILTHRISSCQAALAGMAWKSKGGQRGFRERERESVVAALVVYVSVDASP